MAHTPTLDPSHKGGNGLSSLDLIAAVATIGIFLGRIANFINAELYGAPTTLPCSDRDGAGRGLSAFRWKRPIRAILTLA